MGFLGLIFVHSSGGFKVQRDGFDGRIVCESV